jgi:hypothetical protein
MGMCTLWWRTPVVHTFLYGNIIPYDVDTMKTYLCSECDDRTDNCAACVFDTTPEEFDKSIMDVFCKRIDSKKPKWVLREVTQYYYETF